MRRDKSEELSTGDIKRILDNISGSSVIMTSFEGGEPLLREDIGELIEYARRCNFYLLFTTSDRDVFKYPIREYCSFIDFLHISIDEGHNNLEMFDLLQEFKKLPSKVSVQVVVTDESINSLDWKVEQCYKAGIGIVIIPASPMEEAINCFPDIGELEKKMRYLRKMYPDTIHTPVGYFEAYKNRKCSTASIIIAPDGHLYYPCHILGIKGPDLRKINLTEWLISEEAVTLRNKMKECKKNCGWYQYYSIESYLSPFSIFQNLRPVLFTK
jgi:MoaA/NifB/PqqE/SkfB family radical SAM enzyme